MSRAVTLHDASARLRKPPGRPRKVKPEASAHTPAPPIMRPAATATSGVWPKQPAPSRSAAGDQRNPATVPRLLTLKAAADYVSRSTWTIRAWVAAGLLVPVRLPATKADQGARRRILIDRRALDELIDAGQGAP